MKVYPIFLPDSLTRAVRKHVHNSPENRNPRFNRAGRLVQVRGGILRYSTTTPRRSTS